MTASTRTEFKVVFDGIDLPDEARTAIEQAITRAVAGEVARFDFAGDLIEQPIRPGGGTIGRMYTAKDET